MIFDVVYNHAGGGFDDQSLYFLDRLRSTSNNDSLYFTEQRMGRRPRLCLLEGRGDTSTDRQCAHAPSRSTASMASAMTR